MTEEEKQAIDILNNVVADEVVGTYCLEIQKTTNCADNCKDDDCFIIKAIDTVTNLIDKQQKEIEDMREELQMYVDTNVMKEKLENEIEELNAEILELTNQITDGFLENDRLRNEIEKQQKEIEELKKENFDTVYIQAIENYKDKIRKIIYGNYEDLEIILLIKELLEE